jgi:hypothetical protein
MWALRMSSGQPRRRRLLLSDFSGVKLSRKTDRSFALAPKIALPRDGGGQQHASEQSDGCEQ